MWPDSTAQKLIEEKNWISLLSYSEDLLLNKKIDLEQFKNIIRLSEEEILKPKSKKLIADLSKNKVIKQLNLKEGSFNQKLVSLLIEKPRSFKEIASKLNFDKHEASVLRKKICAFKGKFPQLIVRTGGLYILKGLP